MKGELAKIGGQIVKEFLIHNDVDLNPITPEDRKMVIKSGLLSF